MFAQVDGRKRGLPVMCVDDIRREEIARYRQGGHREHSEPEIVIDVVVSARSVYPIAIKERRAMNEVERDVALGCLVDVGYEAWADWNPKISISNCRRRWINVVPVVRNDHRDVFAARCERGRQSADDVSKAAGLREW